MQKKNNPTDLNIKQAYNLFRNRTTREIKKAKKLCYKNFFNDNLANMKKTWQGIKEIISLNKSNSTNIDELNYQGEKLSSEDEMANAFNEFFTNVGPNLDKHIPKSQRPNRELHYLGPRIPHTFLISPTNYDEIIDIINNLDDSKSSGPSSIPIKLLKLVKNEIAFPLIDICNSSFEPN